VLDRCFHWRVDDTVEIDAYQTAIFDGATQMVGPGCRKKHLQFEKRVLKQKEAVFQPATSEMLLRSGDPFLRQNSIPTERPTFVLKSETVLE
jgi:hypothetical protein